MYIVDSNVGHDMYLVILRLYVLRGATSQAKLE